MDDYYLFFNGTQIGPHPLGVLRSMFRMRQIDAATLYWQEGLTEWLPLGTISDLVDPTPLVKSPPMQRRLLPVSAASQPTILYAKGVGGELELHDDAIVIRRKGVLAFSTHGFAGDKRIMLAQVSAVRFKPAGSFLSGFIQFSFLGGKEGPSGLLDATADENSVVFGKSDEPAFLRIKAVVEERVASLCKQRTTPAQNTFSAADELEKLARLKDRGILTEAEFQAKKRQLLGV